MKAIVLVISFLLSATCCGAIDPLFEAAVNYNVAQYPSSLVSDDFDEDGHLDLAVACEDNSVSILIGAGDGSFAAPVDYYCYHCPISIVTEDFNGDEHADLAVANRHTDDVSIFLGVGDGTFLPPVNYEVGGHEQTSIASDDFNEDGHKDLAVVNKYYNQSQVTIFLGTGYGTFASTGYSLIGNGGRGIAAGDFDEDELQDLAVAIAAWDLYDVSVLLGIGDGTFAPAVNYDCIHSPQAVITEDLDEDGHLDLAVANYGMETNSGNMSVFLGDGDGTFASQVSYSAGNRPGALTKGDLDEDGYWDLAVANMQSTTISIFINRTGEQTSVDEGGDAPAVYRLLQNHPNPFSPATTLAFDIPAAGYVNITVYDLTGRVVKVLVDRDYPAGAFETAWNCRNDDGEAVGSGVYLARMTAGGNSAVTRMTLHR
ncbi:FG-GAP-like repeat-containing protein [Candidatus Eisenbacteria bacterium]|uniref:FG-GAP-like repeat-containing protein n=1 Tax=Eiseniibacteriota bacterium TaxID=2212470 RepID=A0ABV6YJT9_UNCEI